MNLITYLIVCDDLNRRQAIIQYSRSHNFNILFIDDINNIKLKDIQTPQYTVINANNENNIDYLFITAHIYYTNYYDIKDRICLITLCYNEIKILPFAINYWKRFANHAIVYDNGSTDGSVEFLQQYNDFAELKYFRYKENNKINDKELSDFKNNVWKEYKDKYDWVIVCDVDELLYIKDVEYFLNYIFTNNIAMVKPCGYQLISTYFPKPDIPCLLHNEVKYGVRDKMFDKCVMFNTHKVKEINYNYGSHKCYPEIIDGTVYQKNDIFLFHAKWLTYQYVNEKHNSIQNKLSDFNIKNGLGIEYLDKNEERRQIFMNMIDKCEFISDWYDNHTPLINDNMLNNVERVKPTNNRLCIYVQLYKTKLSNNELTSFIQLCKIINNRYDIVLSYHNSLNISYYQNLINYLQYQNIKLVCLPEIYFQSVETYNQLCLSWKFYNIFSYYDYMLVYQLDSIIYYDNLEYFMSLNYDFIGAPHNAPYYMCGNGGFSLRKINSIILILKNTDIDLHIYEDIFINSKIINKTPINIARMFAISYPKDDEYSEYIAQPMGEHYFDVEKISNTIFI